jgi:penicillin amidase
VQAQDRLFQMDLWRRASQGRLSEILGSDFVGRDVATRRMRYRGDMTAEWASYGPDTKAIAEAFVRGINAWVELARDRPPEAFVLAGWLPEEWSASDLLARGDAFRGSGDAIDEVFRGRLAVAAGVSHMDTLLGRQHIAASPDLDLSVISPVIADALRRVAAPPVIFALASPVRTGVPGDVGSSPPPSRDEDTAARALEHPSPRYLVHLHAPGWNVIGATAPWLPGVAAGHNGRVAWRLAPFDADTQDLYVEKVNPSNNREVEDAGRWSGMTMVKDAFRVKGRPKPFEYEQAFTRHGAIVAENTARHLVFAVRWSGGEPGGAELGALALDTASSAPALRDALRRWRMPARTVEYEDADGARGFQAAALVPVRREGGGVLPSAGWTAADDWIGWRTLDDLPHGGANARRPRVEDVEARLLLFVRTRPGAVDALLRDVAAARSLDAQKAAIMKAASVAGDEQAARIATPVVFAYPLSIGAAARARFDIGPMTPPEDLQTFSLILDAHDWDASTAANAPGQSESADDTHFADLAKAWAAGRRVPLAFSDAAVQASAEATLTLTPKR